MDDPDDNPRDYTLTYIYATSTKMKPILKWAILVSAIVGILAVTALVLALTLTGKGGDEAPNARTMYFAMNLDGTLFSRKFLEFNKKDCSPQKDLDTTRDAISAMKDMDLLYSFILFAEDAKVTSPVSWKEAVAQLGTLDVNTQASTFKQAPAIREFIKRKGENDLLVYYIPCGFDYRKDDDLNDFVNEMKKAGIEEKILIVSSVQPIDVVSDLYKVTSRNAAGKDDKNIINRISEFGNAGTTSVTGFKDETTSSATIPTTTPSPTTSKIIQETTKLSTTARRTRPTRRIPSTSKPRTTTESISTKEPEDDTTMKSTTTTTEENGTTNAATSTTESVTNSTTETSPTVETVTTTSENPTANPVTSTTGPVTSTTAQTSSSGATVTLEEDVTTILPKSSTESVTDSTTQTSLTVETVTTTSENPTTNPVTSTTGPVTSSTAEISSSGATVTPEKDSTTDFSTSSTESQTDSTAQTSPTVQTVPPTEGNASTSSVTSTTESVTNSTAQTSSSGATVTKENVISTDTKTSEIPVTNAATGVTSAEI
ncbi:hypothetical protein RB195_020841 [Necator americanus]|uniref:VWFA domain-containing protein n=1 Tax=Necator americanus TaxID=51031 RepID=A0ABR1CKT0_NECAM